MERQPSEEEAYDAHASQGKEGTRKEKTSLKDKVEAMEAQIKQISDEHDRISDAVEKLKVVNALLYKEVHKTYFSMKKDPLD